MRTLGLHHVSVISGPPAGNARYYTRTLGLRLVKRTVNFDAPSGYHLYFGDRLGRPGSLLTTFPYPAARVGCVGAGMASAVAFAVGPGDVEAWMGRFADAGMDFEAPVERFGEPVLALTDPDGLPLELVERRDLGTPDDDAPRPDCLAPAHALRHLDGVTLALADPEPTARILRDVLGYAEAGEENGRLRFLASGDRAERLDLTRDTRSTCGGMGTVHHIAFRAEADQLDAWRDRVASAGLDVTEVRDRQYFRSIYFREPGGVLFEIATDDPGFTTDEPADALGATLRLPPWLEARRDQIESRLPVLS